MGITKIKKRDSIIVVDIGSKLTLIDVSPKGRLRVNALESVGLSKEINQDFALNYISSFIKENNIRNKNVILKLRLKSLFIKRIQLPAIPDSELPEAIKWKVKDEVSFDISEAELGFSVIKKSTKDDGAKVVDLICVLAKEKEVRGQVLLLKQAGLNCLSAELLPFGYARLVEKYFMQAQDETLGVLHLAHDRCFIALYKNAKLSFYRELP
ncbi:pilus assembly protein PilM, partial [Thermoproteota archaeon]